MEVWGFYTLSQILFWFMNRQDKKKHKKTKTNKRDSRIYQLTAYVTDAVVDSLYGPLRQIKGTTSVPLKHIESPKFLLSIFSVNQAGNS